jgi:fibronectin type 3 domain-containing protein
VLTWTPADGLAAHFHVERQIAGAGAFTEIAVVLAPATTFTDTGVTAGVPYQYRVRAENDYGFSAYSGVGTGTVPVAQLAPPSNVQAVPASQTQINLTWNTANTSATKFHIERKSGANGTYAEIAAVPSTTTGYQDNTLQPSTTYTYRMRSEGVTGVLSSYSSETSATTPALPLPPAPTLQATATSSSQVHLSWSTTATGIMLFSVERRTATGGYSQISQPTATSTSFDDSALTGSTTYLYRMRVQTGAGFSPYSNETTVTTLQALPAAPTNLQATAIPSSQVNLNWTNNAPDATAIRVEYLPPGSATFVDIFAAATLTATGVTNLQPNTAYSFRVRAQNAAGYSAYSNVVVVTTLPVPTTVFLLHGIGQSARDMQSLKTTLGNALDGHKYIIDARFSYVCASSPSCPASCTISNGAIQLASQILNSTTSGSRIILVGYSMGGLIARDMIANNYSGITTSRKIAALVTLGTPNLGYPYGSLDSSLIGTIFSGTCPLLSQQMMSDFRSQQSSNTVILSPYLSGLTTKWNSVSFNSISGYWLAISGGYCKNPIRTGDLTGTLGCPDSNKISDGVVCDQSARYVLNGANTPTQTWYGDAYAHAAEVILCGFFDSAPLLFNPMAGDILSQELVSVISQH